MKKIIITVVILAAVGIGAYYTFINRNSSKTSSSNPPASNNYGADNSMPTPAIKTPAASSVTVEIKNFSFNPSAVTVKAGTKVIWANNDFVSHTVTSDSGNLLGSSAIAPGQSFSFTFNNAGTVNYHCSIHPMMKGEVIVTKN